MKKYAWLILIAGVSIAQTFYKYPSNSVAITNVITNASTTLVVATPLPTTAIGKVASIIAGVVPNPPDVSIEPVTVSSQSGYNVVVVRNAFPKSHTLRSQPRLKYFVPPTATNTPTNTFTSTYTNTNTPTYTNTITPTPTSTFAEGPVAVTTAGTGMQVTQNLHIPGTLFVDSIVNSNTKNFFLLNTGVEQIGDTSVPCQIAGSSITVTGAGDFVTNCGGSSRIHNVISPTNGGDASSKTYTDALTNSNPPTPGPRRIGDIYVNTSDPGTVYVGISTTPVSGWLQVKP